MTWKPKAGRRGRSSVTQRLKTKSQQPQLVWQGTSGAAPPLLPALHCCHLWDGLNVKPVSLAASGWWRIKPHPSEWRQPHSSLQISSFVKALLENHGFFTKNKQGYDRRSNCCRRSGENERTRTEEKLHEASNLLTHQHEHVQQAATHLHWLLVSSSSPQPYFAFSQPVSAPLHSFLVQRLFNVITFSKRPLRRRGGNVPTLFDFWSGLSNSPVAWFTTYEAVVWLSVDLRGTYL